MKNDLTPLEKFWKYVRRTDGCWEWTGGITGRPGSGYGAISLGYGQQIKAHRFSYEIHHGPIPDGLYVCHSCDNPKCVNPSHLYAGTATDNNRDTIARNRRRDTHRSHCVRGHPLSGDNLLATSSGRRCKACKYADNRRGFARHPEWLEQMRVNATARRRERSANRPPKPRPPLSSHCKRGHEYTPENTHIVTTGGKRARRCRTCAREYMREYQRGMKRQDTA